MPGSTNRVHSRPPCSLPWWPCKDKESQEWILQGSIHGSGRLSGHKGWLGVRELDIQTRSLFYLLPFSTPFSCPEAIVGWHWSHLGAFEQIFQQTPEYYEGFFFSNFITNQNWSELPFQNCPGNRIKRNIKSVNFVSPFFLVLPHHWGVGIGPTLFEQGKLRKTILSGAALFGACR